MNFVLKIEDQMRDSQAGMYPDSEIPSMLSSNRTPEEGAKIKRWFKYDGWITKPGEKQSLFRRRHWSSGDKLPSLFKFPSLQNENFKTQITNLTRNKQNFRPLKVRKPYSLWIWTFQWELHSSVGQLTLIITQFLCTTSGSHCLKS